MELRGRCGCGNLSFEVNGEPLAQLYCHCRSCQVGHAAPIVAAAMFRSSDVTYRGESRRITVTERAGATPRIICPRCGTKVVNEPVPTVRAILPALCETSAWFEPTMHVQWQDHILDVKDDLPRYLDYPTELGGTGLKAD